MPDEVITAENLSKELVKGIFDAAFMETGYDSDGDLWVRDKCRVFVFCDRDKRVVQLRAFFRFSSGTSEFRRLKCANDINADYFIVRAVATERQLIFGYDVPLEGGVSKKTLVLLFKRFASIPFPAVEKHGSDIIE